jgi:hypothetical protein
MNNIVGVDALGDPLIHLGCRAAVGVSPYEKPRILHNKSFDFFPNSTSK